MPADTPRDLADARDGANTTAPLALRLRGELFLRDAQIMRDGEAWAEPGGALLDGGARREITPGARVLAWSGTTAGEAFGDDPRRWIGAGWSAVEEAFAAVRPGLQANRSRLLVRPHFLHVVGDIPGCKRLLGVGKHQTPREPGEAHADEQVGLLLDPASMLAPDMLGRAEDHLTRIAEALGPWCDALLLANLREATAEERGAVEAGDLPPLLPAPAHKGLLPIGALARIALFLAPWGAPVALVDDRTDEQVAALREAGLAMRVGDD